MGLGAAVAALALSCAAASPVAPLTLFPASTLGKCLDQTPSGFYFLNQSSTKWVIAFDGGGECNSQASCSSKLSTSLGSSKYFAPSAYFDDAGSWFLDTDASRNPGFASWNKVRIPYCTQDLHMGTVTTASDATFGLLFSGQRVFEAVLDALDAAGLTRATDILLSGESAGGIAVWPKLDATAARYPEARVSGAPVAGFYSYSFPYTGPNATSAGGLPSFTRAGLAELYALYAPALDASCAAAYGADPSPCMLSNNSLPFVRAPVFVTEALSDSVQLTAHDSINAAFRTLPPELAYISAWEANMSAALAPVLTAGNPRSGGFAAACWLHTGFSAARPTVGGVGFLQAAAAWYAQAGGAYKVQDSCGAPFCNPTCPPA